MQPAEGHATSGISRPLSTQHAWNSSQDSFGVPHHSVPAIAQAGKIRPGPDFSLGAPAKGPSSQSDFPPVQGCIAGGAPSLHQFSSEASILSATHSASAGAPFLTSSGHTFSQNPQVMAQVQLTNGTMKEGSNPRLHHMALVRNEEQRQRDQLPQQFRVSFKYRARIRKSNSRHSNMRWNFNWTA